MLWNHTYDPVATHEICAVRTALDCLQDFEERVKPAWQLQNLPTFDIRIGIQSGLVLVGNIGSKRRINFTAIGDNVNISSRLEGLNKVYGTQLLIGESTWLQACNEFCCLWVDIVIVKGKTLATSIYTPICYKSKATPELLSLETSLLRVKAHVEAKNVPQALSELAAISKEDKKLFAFIDHLEHRLSNIDPMLDSIFAIMLSK